MPSEPLAQRLEHVESYIANTKAIIKHKGNVACFVPSKDEIHMPKKEAFIDTDHSTAAETITPFCCMSWYIGQDTLTDWTGFSATALATIPTQLKN